MRTRAEMKTAAKQNFARYNSVFLAIGAVLVAAGFICNLPSIIGSMPSTQEVQNLTTRTSETLSKGSAASTTEINRLTEQWLNLYSKGKSTSASLYLAALTLLLLLGFMVLQVGLSHVALVVSAGGEPKFKDFFMPLKHFGRWLGLYLMMFIRVLLWSLLLFVPGVIAAYGYSQAVYLMLEDPELGANRALKLSGQLMSGYRWRLFVLEISFILWVLLGYLINIFFAMNLLGLYLIPYMELTYVQFYRDLRAEHPVEGLPVVGALQVEQPPLTPEPPAVSAQ